MPGYVIHLAIAKEYMKNNKVENESEFFKGVIAVDMLKTFNSHYGIKENKFDIEGFKRDIDFSSSYGKGYFLHLISDYIFYYNFYPDLTKEIRNDYDILNEYLIKKYDVNIPIELESIVKFKKGIPTFINEVSICEFIDSVSKINLEQYIVEVIK